jgi:hypothetical protein
VNVNLDGLWRLFNAGDSAFVVFADKVVQTRIRDLMKRT